MRDKLRRTMEQGKMYYQSSTSLGLTKRMNMLEIKGLYKNFNGVQAVQDFSLKLEAGKVTSLIGPNGAGKTTVFNIVTGFLDASQGNVLYQGKKILDRTPWQIAQSGISRTFQNLRLFRKLTTLENILLGRQKQSGENVLQALFTFSENSSEHRQNIEKAMEHLVYVGLEDKRNDIAENLSYGQQKLLSIACCLAAEPELLMLDEPVSGVQPVMIEKIETIIHELIRQKKTVFLIEHDIDFVLRISDTVVVMDDGRKIAEGTPSVIQNKPEILEAYLS
jgi:ABC-type branched-subunit amino acid transport system ATPase component